MENKHIKSYIIKLFLKSFKALVSEDVKKEEKKKKPILHHQILLYLFY